MHVVTLCGSAMWCVLLVCMGVKWKQQCYPPQMPRTVLPCVVVLQDSCFNVTLDCMRVTLKQQSWTTTTMARRVTPIYVELAYSCWFHIIHTVQTCTPSCKKKRLLTHRPPAVLLNVSLLQNQSMHLLGWPFQHLPSARPNKTLMRNDQL